MSRTTAFPSSCSHRFATTFVVWSILSAVFVFAGCSEPYVGVPLPVVSEEIMVEQVLVNGKSDVEHIEVDFSEAARTPGKLVIVDFWARWCGPCNMLARELEEVAAKRGDDVILLKVNVDEQQFLSQHFGAQAIPDLRFFRDGEPVGGVVGFRTAEDLLEELP